MRAPTPNPRKVRHNNRLDEILAICDEHLVNLPSTPPLGPDFRELSGGALADALVLHRLRSVYEVPIKGAAALRKQRSIDSVVEYDLRGFEYTPPQLGSDIHFLRARRFIRDVDRNFQLTYRLRFPTGESATSTGGSPDFFHKLFDTRYWECSPASFAFVCKIFYRNLYMRRFVKVAFYRTCLSDFGWSKADAARRNRLLYEEGGPIRVFKHMMSVLVTLRDTSRLTVVPKNNEKDRVITCEPFLTMICQLSVMGDLRSALIRTTGLDLRVLQDWHGARLRSGVATIDLKNASNSVWLAVVKAFYEGTKMYSPIMSLRTPITELPDGSYHQFAMYSPMGCGLTFDVMTLLLTGLARAFDTSATVFGDDIMVRTEHVDGFVKYLQKCGFTVNANKSFWDGNFRESCGYFADLANDRLLVSYEMRRPTTLMEAYTFMNKLYRILEARQITTDLRKRLSNLHGRLLSCLPRDAMAGNTAWAPEIPDGFVLTDEAWGFERYDPDLQRLLLLYKSMSTTPQTIATVRNDYCERALGDKRLIELWQVFRMRHGYPVYGKPRIITELHDMAVHSNIRVGTTPA